MFVTQEKILKKVHQERSRGDMKKALRRAVEGLEKFPDDFDLAMEAVQLCFDTGDFKQAVTIIKAAMRKHPGSRSQLMSYARETFDVNFNPLLGSFIIETLVRSRSIDDIRSLLRTSDREYTESLVKRSETRSKGFAEAGGKKTAQFTDNELLLALLYMSSGRSSEAAAPLGRALANSPDDAQLIGELLIELERDLPDDSQVKFTIGLVSFMLGRPEKAEKRFFQCLELPDPPLEPMMKLLESSEKPAPDQKMLTGEILVRMGDEDRGLALIKEYIEDPGQAGALAGSTHGEGFRDRKDRLSFSFERIRTITGGPVTSEGLSYFAAGLAASLGRVKDGIAELEKFYERCPGNAREVIMWIEGNDETRQSAPGQRFLFDLNMAVKDNNGAARAARLAAEMDPSLSTSLIADLQGALESAGGKDPDLLGALAELYAMNGDSESASGVMEKLEEEADVEKDELFRLTGKILDRCGINLDRVMTAVGLAMKNSDCSGALPWVIEFFRANPDAHGEFASRLKAAAEAGSDTWILLSSMIDSMADEVQLTRPFKILQARGHMVKGEIEKAIFEFDQLIMFDESLRVDLIPVYEKAAEDHPENTTLNLALYQLHFDEETYDRSAHYLCRALESDPGQIRDVLSRFEGLTSREPGNRAIWEEMLTAALNIRHADLAREILSRATDVLAENEAAALSIYGARISAADGRSVESLGHLAAALRSPSVDLRAIEQQLGEIIRKEPLNAEARYLAGETLLRLSREEEAAAQMEKCLELSPDHSERVRVKLEQLLPMSAKPWLVSRILGEISWAQGRRADAYRYFNSAQQGPGESLRGLSEVLCRIHASDPADSRITSIYARGLALEHRYDEAAANLEGLLERDPASTGRIVEILLEMIEDNPVHFASNRLIARIWARSGEAARSLTPVLRMMADREIDQARVERDVDFFLETHGCEPVFLVEYAGLKVRTGGYSAALARYSQAITIDRSRAPQALEGIRAAGWPDGQQPVASLLAADCLTKMGDPSGAFEQLRSISRPRGELMNAVIDRLLVLTGMEAALRYYRFGCALLVENGLCDEAESLAREGLGRLGDDDSRTLMIELGEGFERRGMAGDAARIFREIMEGSPDRDRLWKRIESAWLESTERELAEGTAELAGGSAELDDCDGRVCGELLVRLALDAGRPAEALGIAARADLPPTLGAALRARAYLDMDRPLVALAICGTATRYGDDESLFELLEVEGLASETIGDYGRATSAFMKIAGHRDAGSHIMDRVESNYTRMLQTEIEEKDRVLVKTGTISPAASERKER